MFKNLLHKYHSTSELNRFIIKVIPLFLIWRGFRKWMILKGQNTDFTQSVSSAYLWVAKLFLNIFGISTTVDYSARKLWISGASEAIYIAYDCLGVNLFFVFMVFIFAYPGRIKTKSWLIPLGFLIIFILNAARMAALAKVLECCPSRMDFLHHFVFQGIIYVGIFGMWLWFTKLESKKRSR